MYIIRGTNAPELTDFLEKAHKTVEDTQPTQATAKSDETNASLLRLLRGMNIYLHKDTANLLVKGDNVRLLVKASEIVKLIPDKTMCSNAFEYAINIGESLVKKTDNVVVLGNVADALQGVAEKSGGSVYHLGRIIDVLSLIAEKTGNVAVLEKVVQVGGVVASETCAESILGALARPIGLIARKGSELEKLGSALNEKIEEQRKYSIARNKLPTPRSEPLKPSMRVNRR